MKYSIIVPYRDDLRLKRLLRSIPLDRNDVEILVVDDGSITWKAVEVCAEFAMYGNLHVISTTQSSGAGAARNVGLRKAVGKWLLFADADDFFLPNAFDFIDAEINPDFGIIYFYPVSFNEVQNLSKRASAFRDMCDDFRLAKPGSEWRIRADFVVPWSKVINAQLVKDNDLFFEEVRYANDVLFSLNSALCARKIAVSSAEIYSVTESLSSLTTINSEESFFCRFSVLLRKNKRLRESGLAKYQTQLIGVVYRSRVYGVKAAVKYLKLAFLDASPLLSTGFIKKLWSRCCG